MKQILPVAMRESDFDGLLLSEGKSEQRTWADAPKEKQGPTVFSPSQPKVVPSTSQTGLGHARARMLKASLKQNWVNVKQS